MKKLFFLLTLAVPFLAGCSQTEVLNGENTAVLSFDTHIGKSSRALAVRRFEEGDTIGVYMYHAPTDWATDGIGGSSLLMENVALRLDAGAWIYNPTQFWKQDEKYTFFAYAPYNKEAVINNGVLSYTVGADETKQEDLLYSVLSVQTKDKSWDGSVKVPDKVQFAFTHALSQVKFSVATEYDYSSLYTIELTDIKLNNIYISGNLNLVGESSTVEPWSNLTASGSIDYSPTKLTLGLDLQTITNATGDVWMLLPQTLPADAEVEFTVHLTKVGTQGTASNGDYKLKASLAAGTWEHNKVYNYQLTLNMDQILGVRPIVIGDPVIIEWEEEERHELDPVLPTVRVDIPTAEVGSTDREQILTMKRDANQNSLVNLQTIETWTAHVESGVVPVSIHTRADDTSWLKLADDASGLNASSSKTGMGDASFYIYIASKNDATAPRTATVIVSSIQNPRLKIRIAVTQQGALLPALTVTDGVGDISNGYTLSKESSSGQGSMVQMTATGAWKASSSVDWLQMATDASGSNALPVFTGEAGDHTFYIYLTAANPTSSDRTGVITLSDESGTDIQTTITVTQKKATPFTVTVPDAETSSTATNISLVKSSPSAGSELRISGDGSSLPWTAVSNNPDWLTLADNASGSGSSAEKTGTGDQTLYICASTLAANASDRIGTITLTREGYTTVTIRVTQGSDYVYVGGVKWAKGNVCLTSGGGITQELPNYAGLYFKYGSLIGIKVIGGDTYTPSFVGYRPTEYSGALSTWDAVPYSTTQILGTYTAYAGTGDICKYLSDKKLIGKTGSTWRLPTKDEANSLINMPLKSYGTPTDISANPTEPLTCGVFFGKNAASATNPSSPPTETIFLPAAGVRNPASGALKSYGSYLYCSIGTVKDARYAYCIGSAISYHNLVPSIRDNFGGGPVGMPVRCVRSN